MNVNRYRSLFGPQAQQGFTPSPAPEGLAMPEMQWSPIVHAQMDEKKGGKSFGEMIGGVAGGLARESMSGSPEVKAENIEIGGVDQLDFTNYQPFGGYRAFGGPMFPGYDYIVGERGPEKVKMLPDGTARVIPVNDPPVTAQPSRMGTVEDLSLQNYKPSNRPEPQMVDPGRVDIGGVEQLTKPRMWENAPYSKDPRLEAGPNATERERVLRDIKDLQGTEWKRESKLWKRVGSGVLDGARAWAMNGGQGGLGGLIGTVAGGAVAFGASKGAQADYQKKQEMAKLLGKYQTAMAVEGAEIERQKALQDLKAKGFELNDKVTKRLYDSIIADDLITQEESDQLRNAGVVVNPGDWRQFDTIHNSKGEASVVPKKGPPQPIAAPDMPVNYDAQRRVINVTNPDGSVTPVMGSNKDAIAAAATGQRIQIAKDNADRAERNQARMQSNWERDHALRQKNYDLSVQREGRIVEAAKAKAAKGDAKSQKLTDDLAKAKRAVESLREEADLYFKDPDSEERTKKLEKIAEKERTAIGVYNAIMKQMQGGN